MIPFALLAMAAAMALTTTEIAAAADPVAPENPPGELAAPDLLRALRQGGLVIYVRHGRTERDYADQPTAVPGDCSTQRMLSRQGWMQAKAIGAAFRALAIPTGAVISSEYCRA